MRQAESVMLWERCMSWWDADDKNLVIKRFVCYNSFIMYLKGQIL